MLPAPTADNAPDRVGGRLNAGRIDVKMCDRAQRGLALGIDANSGTRELAREIGRADRRAADVEEDDIRLRLEHAHSGNGPEPIRQEPRIVMIDAQPLDIVVERVEARCSDHTRLPHGPAKPELPLSRGGDEIVIADEDCADRTAEALGQIEPEAVAELAVLLRAGIAGDHRIHQPRAVHMQRQRRLLYGTRNIAQRCPRPDRAAAAVHRLLHMTEPRLRSIDLLGSQWGRALWAGEDATLRRQ